MPPRSRSTYRCTDCSHTVTKWVGQCPHCKAWNTIVESASEATRAVGVQGTMAASTVVTPALRIRDIDATRARHYTTGISEFDRVLGGGYIPGATILIAGEPGVGKSTLLLSAAHLYAEQGHDVLYATGEEAAQQVKHRAMRIGATSDNLYVAAENELGAILGHIDDVKPGLIVADSMQTLASAQVVGRMGGVAQTTEVATILTRVAHERGIPLLLVGQVTKDGNIAGPKVVEHLVDVVLHFEGDKHSTLRMLRGIKNRFGAADEVACFVQESDGIKEVTDPSGLFIGQRDKPVPGTCVTVVVEGKRPLLAEVQALVAKSNLPQPRRGASGLDTARLAMTQAVIDRHGGVRLWDQDVFCATVGGMKITEPAADLAIALAMTSAAADAPLSSNVIALGEVALSGDIRPVPDIERRLAEAGRLGFTRALVPKGTRDKVDGRIKGVALIEVDSVTRAVQIIGQMQDRPTED
jgi:DNA repair protein RadA/Sms